LPEELARADLYGLIARLFHQAPDQELLNQISASIPDGQESQTDDAPLSLFWNSLVELAKNSPAKAWQEEFDLNFISVGRPNVILNGSFYMAGHLNEKPLVDIRRALETFGLEPAE
jgi:TorA maturation chaperone TorD